jgi:hypothetical protein
MAKKKSASKPETISERDEIAVTVSSNLARLSAQGNQINFSKVAENAYGIADALLAYRNK